MILAPPQPSVQPHVDELRQEYIDRHLGCTSCSPGSPSFLDTPTAQNLLTRQSELGIELSEPTIEFVMRTHRDTDARRVYVELGKMACEPNDTRVVTGGIVVMDATVPPSDDRATNVLIQLARIIHSLPECVNFANVSIDELPDGYEILTSGRYLYSACHEADTKFVRALSSPEQNRRTEVMQIGRIPFVQKKNTGEDTALNLTPVETSVGTIPAGCIFGVGRQALQLMRPSIFTMPEEDARRAFVWPDLDELVYSKFKDGDISRAYKRFKELQYEYATQ